MLASVSWAVALLAASAVASPVGTRPHSSRNVQNDCGFVTVKHGGFYKDGKPYYLSSFNYWGAMSLAASEQAGGNISRFETEVKQLHKTGVNNVRIVSRPSRLPFWR